MHPSKRKHTRKKHKNLRRCVWITNSFSMSQILNGMRFWKNKTFMRYMVGLELKMPNTPKFSGQRWRVFCSSRKWLDLLGKQVVYGFQVLFFDEKISRVSTKKNTIIWPKLSKIYIQVKLDGWLPVPHALLTNITKFRSTFDDKQGQVKAILPWDTELPNMRQWEQRIIPV